MKTILPEKKYPPAQHMFLLDMMRKFQLCFDFEGKVNQELLIPDLLPNEEPYTGDWDGSLAFQYHYDVLPSSIISRFIVLMHTYISKNTYWRKGVVLISEDKANRALVKADLEDKKIYILIKGTRESRRTILEIIRSVFHTIHKTIAKLVVKEFVPLPDRPDIGYEYNDLVKMWKKGIKNHYHPAAEREYNIFDLLEGIETQTWREKQRDENKIVYIEGERKMEIHAEKGAVVNVGGVQSVGSNYTESVNQSTQLDSNVKNALILAFNRLREAQLPENYVKSITEDLDLIKKELENKPPEPGKLKKIWERIKLIAPPVAAALETAIKIKTLLS